MTAKCEQDKDYLVFTESFNNVNEFVPKRIKTHIMLRFNNWTEETLKLLCLFMF